MKLFQATPVSPPLPGGSGAGQVNPWDLASWTLLITLVLIAIYTFGDYAISNDEGLQHHYGQLILAYYRSWLTDRSVFHFDNFTWG